MAARDRSCQSAISYDRPSASVWDAVTVLFSSLRERLLRAILSVRVAVSCNIARNIRHCHDPHGIDVVPLEWACPRRRTARRLPSPHGERAANSGPRRGRAFPIQRRSYRRYAFAHVPGVGIVEDRRAAAAWLVVGGKKIGAVAGIAVAYRAVDRLFVLIEMFRKRGVEKLHDGNIEHRARRSAGRSYCRDRARPMAA